MQNVDSSAKIILLQVLKDGTKVMYRDGKKDTFIPLS